MAVLHVPLTPRESGMSLPGMLISLVLIGLVGAIGTTTWLRAARLLAVARERVAIGVATDAALGFVGVELAELAPGDVASGGAGGIAYRAMRLDGHACRVTAGVVDVSRSRVRSERLPQPGRDSLLVLSQTDSGSRWVVSPVLGVGAAWCGPEPAIRIVGDSAALDSTGVLGGGLTPVRTFEVMEVRLYLSGGRQWLGARSVTAGEAIQPLAGPFEAGSGFALLDTAGLPAATATVRAVLSRLEWRRPEWSRQGAGAYDSAQLAIYPRNLAP